MIRMLALTVSCILTSAIAAESQQGAESVKLPVKAEITDARKLPEWNGDPVGNVQVTYADGSKDHWTKLAMARLPKTAPDGTVGWVDCSTTKDGKTELALHKGVPVGSRLVLCQKGKITVRISSQKAFIEEWGFTSDGTFVVIKSRAAHGPASIERFARADGKADGCVAGFADNAPEWAKPYLEN